MDFGGNAAEVGTWREVPWLSQPLLAACVRQPRALFFSGPVWSEPAHLGPKLNFSPDPDGPWVFIFMCRNSPSSLPPPLDVTPHHPPSQNFRTIPPSPSFSRYSPSHRPRSGSGLAARLHWTHQHSSLGTDLRIYEDPHGTFRPMCDDLFHSALLHLLPHLSPISPVLFPSPQDTPPWSHVCTYPEGPHHLCCFRFCSLYVVPHAWPPLPIDFSIPQLPPRSLSKSRGRSSPAFLDLYCLDQDVEGPGSWALL